MMHLGNGAMENASTTSVLSSTTETSHFKHKLCIIGWARFNVPLDTV